MILELGGNDGLRGMPLASTRANLDQMIAAFQSAGAKVVLAGMTLPPNYGPDYIHDFEKIYKDLAAKYKLTLIPFLMADIITKDLRYIQARRHSSHRRRQRDYSWDDHQSDPPVIGRRCTPMNADKTMVSYPRASACIRGGMRYDVACCHPNNPATSAPTVISISCSRSFWLCS